MKDFFDKMLRNFKEFYGELDAGKKISLFAVTGVILVFLLGVVLWATHTNYKVLYSDLNKEDMTKVEVFLSQNNVEKKTSADGRTVSIPEDMIETVRLKMMTSGFSFSGTVGYEVFDNQSFGTTSFVQKVNKQRDHNN